MAPRAAPANPINSNTRNVAKGTHRERLIAAMIAVAVRDGAADSTVTAVIEQAGVSRPTFYEHFTDAGACLIAALNQSLASLIEQTRVAVSAAKPEDATTAAVEALIHFARTQTEIARFVTREPLGAGKCALDARDKALRTIAQIVDDAQKQAGAPALTPDIPSTVLFGAIHRVLASRLRRGESTLPALQDELLDWIKHYEQPQGNQRWRTLKRGRAPREQVPATEPTLKQPLPLPRGRPRLTSEEIAVNHRQRILLAVAELAQQQGYAATTINDIARRAKVDPKVFYKHFTGKQHAFLSFHELAFRAVMRVTASAFFEEATWPQRSWHAGVAFARHLENEPLTAHIAFIEAYNIGAMAVQRVDDSHTAFTLFLQEGYQHAAGNPAGAGHLGELALEAIFTAIYELAYLEIRGGRTGALSRTLGASAAIFLTPFLGAKDTNAFIDGQLRGKPVRKAP